MQSLRIIFDDIDIARTIFRSCVPATDGGLRHLSEERYPVAVNRFGCALRLAVSFIGLLMIIIFLLLINLFIYLRGIIRDVR